jgi:hypothetical protein
VSDNEMIREEIQVGRRQPPLDKGEDRGGSTCHLDNKRNSAPQVKIKQQNYTLESNKVQGMIGSAPDDAQAAIQSH